MLFGSVKAKWRLFDLCPRSSPGGEARSAGIGQSHGRRRSGQL